MTSEKDIAERYEQWYRTPWGEYADHAEKRLLSALARPRPGESVLDVGCGTGRYLQWFSDRSAQSVGVDISYDMLCAARKRSPILQRDAWVCVADAHALPFPDRTFDLVTAITSLEFMREPAQAVREMVRVCRGRLFLGVLCRNSFYARHIARKGTASTLARAHLYSVCELLRLVRTALDGPSHQWRTTLLAPPAQSQPGVEWAAAVDRLPGADRLPWGAYIGLVVDTS